MQVILFNDMIDMFKNAFIYQMKKHNSFKWIGETS